MRLGLASALVVVVESSLLALVVVVVSSPCEAGGDEAGEAGE